MKSKPSKMCNKTKKELKELVLILEAEVKGLKSLFNNAVSEIVDLKRQLASKEIR